VRGEYEVKRTAAWAILSWGISINSTKISKNTIELVE